MSRTEPILLVDDEAALRDEVRRGLVALGFQVSAVDSVRAAERWLETRQARLVLLDITMPQADGWELLPEIARGLGVPVIVLTANADLTTRVRAFREGAVDYLAKPFFIEELAARIRSRLNAEAFGTSRTVLNFGELSLDLEARTARVAGADISLTGAEFDILAYLAARPGRAISRATLGDQVLPQDTDRLERTIDSHVSRIRGKLGTASGLIRTVWGIGWKLDPSSGEC